MKNILITGVNSYIGNNVADWLNKDPEEYKIEKISLRTDEWKEKDFSKYDVVFHVAGIAHVSKDPNMKEKYYRVNRDLTIEIAKKSKNDVVNQFIFMSSIIVYGDGHKNGLITKDTIPKPNDFYGDSKLQAEKGIELLDNDDFKVVIIRPPMIYGKESKGNYPKLAKIAKITPIFPDFDNKRSMLHIDNLSQFIKLVIDNNESGLFYPQNEEYVKTSEMVRIISESYGKKIKLIRMFNPFIDILKRRVGIVNKVFGNLFYKQSMSDYDKDNYQIRDLKESIKRTEK